LQKSLKNPQNLKKHDLSKVFKFFGSPDSFATFTTGEFALNEVRLFSKKEFGGGAGVEPLRSAVL
jgi:hypothetical protein